MNFQSVKRVLFSITAASMLAVGFQTTVHAKPALVVKEPSLCTFFDADGNRVSGDFTLVVTYSETGVSHLKCTAKGLDNSTGSAVLYDAYDNPVYNAAKPNKAEPTPCYYFWADEAGVTTDWHMTISEDGNATLRCDFKE